MHSFICSFSLLLLTLLISTCLSSQVIDLTPSTIHSHLHSETPLLLEFYAPWCRHCRDFEPSYHQIASALYPHATVARVDGSTFRLLALRFGVQAFPSFFLVQPTAVTEYEGPRSAQDLIRFVRTKGEGGIAKKRSRWTGPTGLYWTTVDLIFGGGRYLSTEAEKRVGGNQVPAWKLWLVGVGIFAFVLAVFVAVIHFVTMPVPIHSQRPHAD